MSAVTSVVVTALALAALLIAGLNLRGVAVEEISRGDALLTPDAFRRTADLDVTRVRVRRRCPRRGQAFKDGSCRCAVPWAPARRHLCWRELYPPGPCRCIFPWRRELRCGA